MPIKQHGRQYDLVVFGATGYTGKYAAQYITTHLPTDLKWAVAGRSQSKLEEVVAECKRLNPDRVQPAVEVCSLTDEDLAGLAKKTFVLATTVGPYGKLGEHAFKACAEHGTHYIDVTGEVPFVARMIKKYEETARRTGALMFPQIGIESAPPDLLTWSLASFIRNEFGSPTADVTVSRTWGLLAATPSRRAQAYGGRFSFREYLRPRNWLTGVAVHYGLVLLGLVMLTPWLRRLARRFVTPPGQGPDPDVASHDEIEYRGIARRDGGAGERAIGRAEFRGSAYYLTGILLAEAASTLLEEDVDLPGGVYTAACLGQPLIDRLARGGLRFETKRLEDY
ncbi:hypothetical protein VTH06DRAFT_3447 [Thermothelomyces fergusii]